MNKINIKRCKECCSKPRVHAVGVSAYVKCTGCGRKTGLGYPDTVYNEWQQQNKRSTWCKGDITNSKY